MTDMWIDSRLVIWQTETTTTMYEERKNWHEIFFE
jgi:hypothetical protein